MSSRNTLGIEGNALNLSLTGSQLSQRSVNNDRQNLQKKTPSYTNRVSSARSSNSYLDQLKTPKNGSKVIATNKSRNIPINPASKKPTFDRNGLSYRENNKSNIFTPLSVRSSTDEFDPPAKMSSLQSEVSQKDALNIFFGESEDHEINLDKYKINENDFQIESGISNFDFIDPVKDAKINKLQSSVDNLRKELQLESSMNESNEQLKIRVENTRRKIAAGKIQRWYKGHRAERLNNLSEMHKIFDQKRDEIKTKLAVQHNSDKSSVYQKKNKSSFGKEHKSVASKFLNIDRQPMSGRSSSSNQNKSPRTSNKKQSNESPRNNPPKSMPSDVTTTVIKNIGSSTTVESLLTSLDKIEKESTDLLKIDTKRNVNETSSISTIKSDEKVNSILDYLNDVNIKESTHEFIPKAFKDYNYDFNFNLDMNDLHHNPPEKKPEEIKKPAVKTAETPRSRRNSISKPSATVKAKKVVVESKSPTNEILEKKISHEIELTDQINEQKLEIADKTRTITMLEKALNQQKELTLRHTHDADNEMKMRLQVQKNDYEGTIQRHLNFIDQLIDDKKNLSDKCEKLIKQLTDVEKNYSDKFRVSEERHKFETQKLKDTFETAEKIRREKWIEDKTKKIKEMTVKGLEPEIQSLISRHKNEIKTLKSIHEAELLQADERASQRYIKITEELRENYEREKDASVQKEREVAKQRYEKSLQEEENSFLEQRRRLYKEIEEEKNRIADQGTFQRQELDRLRKTLEENNLSSIDTIKKEYTMIQRELEKKHGDELKNLTEKLQIEKQSWEENHLKKQENWALQKERELKDKIKRERDKEIELLIAKFEADSTMTREESERTADSRIKRIRDKYESELQEVEKTERDTMERFNILKAKFNEQEGDYERLKVVCKQKEKEMEGIKKLTDVLQDERNRLADVIRQDFSDRLIFTEEENKKIKLDMVEIKSRHQYDIDKKKEEFEKLKREKSEELDTVHEKIKQVLAKKDEAAAQVKQQYEAACKRADHLEGLLEQQRSLMLKKQYQP